LLTQCIGGWYAKNTSASAEPASLIRMDKNWQGKIALITGASSGIGESCAYFLAARGLRVVLTARREHRLNEIAQAIQQQGGQAHFFAHDLSDEQARLQLTQQIAELVGPVDVLINNAGFGWYGYFHKMDWLDAARMISVNVAATAHLTRLMLPGMLARHSGHIINISSIAGSLPNQGIAIYSASKAFVDAFTTALHRELRGSGVHASAIRLGPVKTPFFNQARNMKNGGSVPAERFAIPVERVNWAIWQLLQHPQRVMYLPGWLRVSRLVEPMFSGLIDRLGPLLLRRVEPRNEIRAK